MASALSTPFYGEKVRTLSLYIYIYLYLSIYIYKYVAVLARDNRIDGSVYSVRLETGRSQCPWTYAKLSRFNRVEQLVSSNS